MNQQLKLNIIPFAPSQPIQAFSFYTMDKGNLFRIHKKKLEGLLESLIREEDLHEGKYLYTDFRQHKDALTLPVNLTEHIHFAAHYYRYLIQQHFSGIGEAIRPNFIKE